MNYMIFFKYIYTKSKKTNVEIFKNTIMFEYYSEEDVDFVEDVFEDFIFPIMIVVLLSSSIALWGS